MRVERIVKRLNLKRQIAVLKLKLKAVDNTLRKHGVAQVAIDRIVHAADDLSYDTLPVGGPVSQDHNPQTMRLPCRSRSLLS